MKPHRIFSEHIEDEALKQFFEALKQPEVVRGALMPDAHSGYTLPIGAVVAVNGALFPSYVGYDIGCGMCAVPTSFSVAEVRAKAQAIFDQIYRDVPVGFSHNKHSTQYDYKGEVSDFAQRDLIDSGAPGKQIGTLGGGNHFIEIGEDETGAVWVIIHSGSRNVGHKIASHYMVLANDEFLVRQGGKPDGKKREGHYALYDGSVAFDDYRRDLAFGLSFALANRKLLMERIESAIHHTGITGEVSWDLLINRNHNHAEFTDGLWIHRKGATHADAGMLGVIPGNMRDGSFIVRGKGNPESLCSSSHGAGRVLGRKAAQASLLVGDFIDTMKGITAKVGSDTLDEAPMAYKDIHQVMREQADLVEILHHIKPIINIKG